MSAPMRPELTVKCLELIYSQSANANLASVAGGTLLGVMFWDLANQALILSWGAAYLLMILYRYRLGLRFRAAAAAESSLRWVTRFRAAVFVCGLLWGAYALYLASLGNAQQVAVVALTVGALLSGAAIAYSVLISVFLAFSVPAVVPLGLFLLARGRPDEIFLGVLMLIWMVFMYRSASRFRDFAIRSLGYQFENTTLLLSLAQQRDRATELAGKLQELSHTDSLTGLANRRRFDQVLSEAWSAAAAAGLPLSVVLADVDHFKPYNDAYGHPAGDECLRQVARVLEDAALAAGGLTARVGGEEFALWVPGADAGDLHALAELARRKIEALGIPHRDAAGREVVTMSFGVATVLASQERTPSHLLVESDRALYAAKSRGRNCVALAGD